MLRVFGPALQCGATDLMMTPVPALIAYISTILPLLPDDLIVSGTADCVRAKRKSPFCLKPGDIAEVEIGCIGIPRNTVGAEA